MEPVSDQDFEFKVLLSERPVVVDFWAAWCAPCRMIEPAIEELAAELGDRVFFCKIDVDANQQVPAAFQVKVFPTVMVFFQGRPAASQVGYRSDFKTLLAGHLQPLLE